MEEKEKKLTLSLCIIAKNEAKNIRKCLQYIGGTVSEILLLDTGSDDGTPEVARALGVDVYHYNWDEDYARARNTLVEKTKHDWILWIDCDEVYPPELVEEIKRAVKEDSEYSGYFFPRKNHYFGKWLKYGGHYPDYQLKLFRKSSFNGYTCRLHEKAGLTGNVGKLKNPCDHHPFNTVEDYFVKFDRYTSIDAKVMYEKGVGTGFINTMSWLFIKPLFRFLRRFFIKGGFLNGKEGFFAAFFDSATYIVRYIKLTKIKRKKNSTEKAG